MLYRKASLHCGLRNRFVVHPVEYTVVLQIVFDQNCIEFLNVSRVVGLGVELEGFDIGQYFANLSGQTMTNLIGLEKFHDS